MLGATTLRRMRTTMTKVLEGKVAVVAGGNSGMGLATAMRFVAEGAHVVITGRRQEQIDRALKEIGSSKAIGVQGDVANMKDLDRLYATVKEKYGHIGLLFSVQKALPLMKEGSSIILNASIAGSTGTPAFGVYAATKAAVRSFARSWTSDLKDRKIRVNTLSPGPIATPIFGKIGLSEQQAQEFGASIVQSVPMGRIGTPEEIASAVLFLASNESSYISGIELAVDGGMAQV